MFTDSAPVLEVALAAKAGLGWRGKHTLLLTRDMGSYFFLGEIYTDLPLPDDAARHRALRHVHGVHRRLPDRRDRRAVRARCAPLHLVPDDRARGQHSRAAAPLIGNRVYGCDDCQLACPWNRYAVASTAADFAAVRNGLDGARLTTLFAWSEATFLRNTEGSAIRRIGYERWSRNIAVALGNAAPDAVDRRRAAKRADDPSPLVREHVAWALEQQRKRSGGTPASP